MNIETRLFPSTSGPRKTERFRVLMAAPLYHPARGGLGQQAQILTESLAARGHSVLVATRKMRELPPARFDPRVLIARLSGPRQNLHNYDRASLETFLVSANFGLRLASLIARQHARFDILHFHGASLPLILALPAAKAYGKKVVALVAGADQGFEAGDLSRRYGPLGPLLSAWLGMVDCYTALSPQIEEALRGEGYREDQVLALPNLVDTERFAPPSEKQRQAIRARLAWPEDARVAIAVARLVPLKGIDALITAFASVAPLVQRSRLVIVGDGPAAAELRSLARGLGIADKVQFLGFREDVPELLKAADLFVLPSLSEGSPNSLLEAMSSGLPCIASDLGGCRASLPQEAGVLVPAGSAEALIGPMVTLLIDATSREIMGLAGRERILRRHRPAFMTSRVEALYRSLLDGSPRPPKLREWSGFDGPAACADEHPSESAPSESSLEAWS